MIQPGSACQTTFVAHGAVFASWTPRIPAVKADLGLSDVELGVALLGAPLVGVAGSPPQLFAALAGWGACLGGLDVAMNAQAVAVEKAYRRPILASFHAWWSLGAFVGTGLGALAASVHVPVAAHLTAAGAAGLLVAGPVSRALLAAEVDRGRGRTVGDRITATIGPARTVRRLAGTAAAGLAVALALGVPTAAIAGFAVLGLGPSCVVPVVFGAAARVPGNGAGPALAGVATCGYLGFLIGPPLIGALASALSLPVALGLLVLLTAKVAVLARALKQAAAPVAVPVPS